MFLQAGVKGRESSPCKVIWGASYLFRRPDCHDLSASRHSTVTLLARFRGLSTSTPRSSCLRRKLKRFSSLRILKEVIALGMVKRRSLSRIYDGTKLDFELHSHALSKPLKCPQRRICAAIFQLADICLSNTRPLRKLRLCEPGVLTGINHSLYKHKFRFKGIIFSLNSGS